ncbi:uroporphyrinogen-III methyltransferase [Sulfuriferula multivorans]|uniref:uroporphyrinogen-III C-methyltransferase n=1 Tax=Sulfuriferula multivorans TaxID=1559896 RepID=A0A401JBI2_9PROT|nr:uroporphyrinogen-III C-methyltransferase [Sulfuriferula multivorans]GBL44959.1 uroporphyrinogen-III methyltransferase [Sulfuriferula multivorans]
MQAGKVYLIGAGPGDPELMTLKAVRKLNAADVVLIDDLVNRAVLSHARADARIIEVGKRGGCQSTPQAFIHRQMIAEARAGRVVARLKGGDPFMFGRGGEEVEALRAAGIAVEIISGVTSGMAAPAALGIPVTHRDWAPGVTFVTGHTRDGNSVNWAALAAARTTLVIYMGIKNLPEIVAQLLEAGLPATTPAAVIENGTLAEQRQIKSNLGNLQAATQQAGIGSPAIMVIGEVASLAHIETCTRIAVKAA